jgi:hypothetical protein
MKTNSKEKSVSVKSDTVTSSMKISSSDENIRQICELFQSNYHLKTIQDCYERNRGDMEKTIDELFKAHDSKSTDEKREKRSTAQNQIFSNKMQISTTKPTTTNNRNKKRNPNDDKDIFHRFSMDYKGLLDNSKLEKVWSKVTQETWGNPLPPEEKIALAKIYADQVVEEVYNNQISHQSLEQHVSNSSVKGKRQGLALASVAVNATAEASITDATITFVKFIDLFSGVISQEKLETIWENIIEYDTLDERFEIATLYALEESEKSELIGSEVESSNSTISLKELLIEQETQRSTLKITSSSRKKGNNSSSNKRNDSNSTREAIQQFLIEFFRETPTIKQKDIIEALIESNYNTELTIERLCEQCLKKGSYTRGLSYSEIVFSNSNSKHDISKGSGSSVSSASSSAKVSPKLSPLGSSTARLSVFSFKEVATQPGHDIDDTEFFPASKSILSKLRNKKSDSTNQDRLYRFAYHFLQIIKAKNPHLILEMDETNDYCLTFQGVKSSVVMNHVKYDFEEERNHILTVPIDFHGLPVIQALEIVDTSIDYFIDEYKSDFVKKIILKFIVGRGLHSPGGIPKLGPAILKLLKERNMNNFVPYEGEVLLYLNALK